MIVCYIELYFLKVGVNQAIGRAYSEGSEIIGQRTKAF